MNRKILALIDLAIPMQISESDRQMAEKLANYQPTPHLKERVYWNALAIAITNNYLRIMGIPTDLTAGDSWDTLKCLAFDTADLEISGLGHLECRPVRVPKLQPEQLVESLPKNIPIPLEVQENRLGYVLVAIDEEKENATILGFAKAVTDGQLHLEELESTDELLAHITCIEREIVAIPAPEATSDRATSLIVCLSRWLEGVIEEGWQVIQTTALPTDEAQFAFRARYQRVKRAKLIDLGDNRSLELVVTLALISQSKRDVLIEVRSYREQTHLPSNLRLILADETGKSLMDACTQEENKNIQFELSGEVGDRFQIVIIADRVEVTEHFAI